jgi:[ribosomal protein S5]-alanine N-acetyltransferase
MSERPTRLPPPFISYTRALIGDAIDGDDLDGETIRLEVPHLRHCDEWIVERTRSQEALRPFEPAWPEDGLTRAGFRKRLSQYREDRREGRGAAFFILRRSDGRLVGGCNLNAIQRGVRQAASIGYWSGVEFRRHGYVREAVSLSLSFAFGPLGLHRVEAACLPENEASISLLRGLGFEAEGRARAFLRIDDRWQDHELFAMLASDWPR